MNQQITKYDLSSVEQSNLPAADLKSDFREAMSKLGAAVTIVTTDGPAGKAGFAATAVCSVSDAPPMMLVCLNKGSSAYAATVANGVLCINVLAAEHEPLSRLFGGKTPVEERFAGASWSELATGAPALDGALVSIDCRIRTVADGNSHEVLICEVEAIRQQLAGNGLVYFKRRYHTLQGEG
jgi:flavin reductase